VSEVHPSHVVEASDMFPAAEHCRRCGWYMRFDQGPDKPPRVTRKGAAECIPIKIELREDA
jgi:hypothetical protein